MVKKKINLDPKTIWGKNQKAVFAAIEGSTGHELKINPNIPGKRPTYSSECLRVSSHAMAYRLTITGGSFEFQDPQGNDCSEQDLFIKIASGNGTQTGSPSHQIKRSPVHTQSCEGIVLKAFAGSDITSEQYPTLFSGVYPILVQRFYPGPSDAKILAKMDESESRSTLFRAARTIGIEEGKRNLTSVLENLPDFATVDSEFATTFYETLKHDLMDIFKNKIPNLRRFKRESSIVAKINGWIGENGGGSDFISVLENFVYSGPDSNEESSTFAQSLDTILAGSKNSGFASNKFVVQHGDLRPPHITRDGDGKTVLIDLEGVGRAPEGFDLGTYVCGLEARMADPTRLNIDPLAIAAIAFHYRVAGSLEIAGARNALISNLDTELDFKGYVPGENKENYFVPNQEALRGLINDPSTMEFSIRYLFQGILADLHKYASNCRYGPEKRELFLRNLPTEVREGYGVAEMMENRPNSIRDKFSQIYKFARKGHFDELDQRTNIFQAIYGLADICHQFKIATIPCSQIEYFSKQASPQNLIPVSFQPQKNPSLSPTPTYDSPPNGQKANSG